MMELCVLEKLENWLLLFTANCLKVMPIVLGLSSAIHFGQYSIFQYHLMSQLFLLGMAIGFVAIGRLMDHCCEEIAYRMIIILGLIGVSGYLFVGKNALLVLGLFAAGAEMLCLWRIFDQQSVFKKKMVIAGYWCVTFLPMLFAHMIAEWNAYYGLNHILMGIIFVLIMLLIRSYKYNAKSSMLTINLSEGINSTSVSVYWGVLFLPVVLWTYTLEKILTEGSGAATGEVYIFNLFLLIGGLVSLSSRLKTSYVLHGATLSCILTLGLVYTVSIQYWLAMSLVLAMTNLLPRLMCHLSEKLTGLLSCSKLGRVMAICHVFWIATIYVISRYEIKVVALGVVLFVLSLITFVIHNYGLKWRGQIGLAQR
jgi:hypothetical protein